MQLAFFQKRSTVDLIYGNPSNFVIAQELEGGHLNLLFMYNFKRRRWSMSFLHTTDHINNIWDTNSLVPFQPIRNIKYPVYQ